MQDPQENQSSSFFDTRTMIAVLLVGGLFFGWQKYLETKYPDYYKRDQQQSQEGQKQLVNPTSLVEANRASADSGSPTQRTTQFSSPLQETSLPFGLGQTQFEVSSKGMALKKLTVTNYFDREKKPVVIGAETTTGLFQLGVGGNPLDFKLEKIDSNTIRGVAQADQGTVEQTLFFNQKTQGIESKISLKSLKSPFAGLTVTVSERKAHSSGGGMFMPNLDKQQFTVKTKGKIEHVDGSSQKEGLSKGFEQVSLLSLGSQYFASVLVDKSEIIPEVQLEAPLEGELKAKLLYKPVNFDKDIQLSWVAYAGPKALSTLTAIDSTMGDAVDFGLFGSIGRILLQVMKFFYQISMNWGISIILLTLLVRLLVLPFNISSFKSMKRMQAIQPKLQSIRERYKDDPTALNRETMALMKNEKVNPIGGCLPMLLQMPVFFALYQVLGQSIELYQAPFGLWIHDLSIKDPLYILPVLMGITMFIQQKITPTTMDPAQAKVMQWMPVIFSVFTLGLPAGLTLYIFVSTLFGVIQQQLFMHDRKSGAVVSTASAK